MPPKKRARIVLPKVGVTTRRTRSAKSPTPPPPPPPAATEKVKKSVPEPAPPKTSKETTKLKPKQTNKETDTAPSPPLYNKSEVFERAASMLQESQTLGSAKRQRERLLEQYEDHYYTFNSVNKTLEVFFDILQFFFVQFEIFNLHSFSSHVIVVFHASIYFRAFVDIKSTVLE